MSLASCWIRTGALVNSGSASYKLKHTKSLVGVIHQDASYDNPLINKARGTSKRVTRTFYNDLEILYKNVHKFQRL